MKIQSLLPTEDKIAKDTTNNLISKLETWVIKVEERRDSGPSIYKIPDDIKKVHPKAFKPQQVSLGPYHHGEGHLFPMEKEKYKAFNKFLNRFELPARVIVNRVRGMLEDLQISYNELDDEWKKKPEKFLEIMILDGCFVLEFLLEYEDQQTFKTTEVLRDMLLLENQLPMILLDELYSMAQDQNKDKRVKSLVWQFDDKHSKHREKLLGTKYLHLLDMFEAELSFKWGSGWGKLQRSLVGRGQEIQLSTRFRKAGIKIKRGPTNFNSKKSVLSLPFIEMNAHIESALLNAMAFEKFSGHDQISCSFIILMSNLMEKDEVESFNQLAKGEVLDMWRYDTSVYNEVRKHCNRPWRIWWTTLKDTNFQNPWTIISTLATFVGFVLLILQTLYGMYGYYRPHSS